MSEDEETSIIEYSPPCPDEEVKYPKGPLQGGSLEALASFESLRHLIRRAEVCRDRFLRGRDIGESGFFSWQSLPPDIEYVRRRVEECRAALTVGFRHALQSKEHRIREWALYHDRSIEQIAPLVKALKKFNKDRWRKLDFVQRVNFASRVLKKSDLNPYMEGNLGLAYEEAKGASRLLELSKAYQKIVIEGAYASYRLDWFAEGANSKQTSVASEMKRHIKTIVSISNDLKEYTLAEKIDAATPTLPKIIAFTRSALFDQFKGHLINTTQEQLSKANSLPEKHSDPQSESVGAQKTMASEKPGNDVSPLRDRHVNALEAMIQSKAKDYESRLSGRQIAVKADGPQAEPESYKRHLAELVKWGYAGSAQGQQGGSWVTRAGIKALKQYQQATKK